jgi:hypothetical protein
MGYMGARPEATSALDELRELARGIHPGGPRAASGAQSSHPPLPRLVEHWARSTTSAC